MSNARDPEAKRAYDRDRRARLNGNESPLQFAKRIGLPIRGGEFITLEALLPLAVRTYWKRRPTPPRRTEDAA